VEHNKCIHMILRDAKGPYPASSLLPPCRSSFAPLSACHCPGLVALYASAVLPCLIAPPASSSYCAPWPCYHVRSVATSPLVPSRPLPTLGQISHRQPSPWHSPQSRTSIRQSGTAGAEQAISSAAHRMHTPTCRRRRGRDRKAVVKQSSFRRRSPARKGLQSVRCHPRAECVREPGALGTKICRSAPRT
jgi:hypothetical protein